MSVIAVIRDPAGIRTIIACLVKPVGACPMRDAPFPLQG
jgi:hypothetical protein